MKLRQFQNFSLVMYEITPTSLRIRPQTIFKSKIEEYLFTDILIKDIYEIKHHDKYAYGYVFLFATILGHFGMEMVSNSHAEPTIVVLFSFLTILSIVRVFITRTKIYIPTQNQGLIKLYKRKPSKKTVQKFIYELEGKALLVNKKTSSKIDLKEFLPK